MDGVFNVVFNFYLRGNMSSSNNFEKFHSETIYFIIFVGVFFFFFLWFSSKNIILYCVVPNKIFIKIDDDNDYNKRYYY